MRTKRLLMPLLLPEALQQTHGSIAVLDTGGRDHDGQEQTYQYQPINCREEEVEMKNFSKPAIVVLTLLFMVSLSTIAHAAIYNAPKIISIAISSGGEVYIRWEGLPNPGPCGGNNNNWVVIPPTANATVKALALFLYHTGNQARIDTSGCSGVYENVIMIYSPGG